MNPTRVYDTPVTRTRSHRATAPRWTTTPPRAPRAVHGRLRRIARQLVLLAREHTRNTWRSATHKCVGVTSTIRPPAIRGAIATRHRCHCGNTWYTFREAR